MDLVKLNDTRPQHHLHIIYFESPLLTARERDVFMIVNYAIITAAISLFGVVANVINIIVFFKQGFSSTVNISFFGIAIADLCGLLALLWHTVCTNPLFVYSDSDLVPLEILHFTSGIPHICFVRITGWLTVFITAERCLCIALPLKIKQIITPKVTMMAVAFIYIATILSFEPEFEIAYLDWKFYPEKNRTLYGLVFTSTNSSKEGVIFIVYSVLGTVSFVAVILFTIILVEQLKRKSDWRNKANIKRGVSESMSSRDKKTINMVVLVAVVLIICYIPGVAVSLATFFAVEVRICGRELNVFHAVWSFAFIFEATNASINIFIYYKMSSKYKATFLELFKLSQTID